MRIGPITIVLTRNAEKAERKRKDSAAIAAAMVRQLIADKATYKAKYEALAERYGVGDERAVAPQGGA